MKLRVVSGTLKGRMITIPDRDQAFRPTRERIRESVAAILTNDIHDAVVADVCAGSGAMGFELLSRGARRAVFVESDRFRCKLIMMHAEKFGIASRCITMEQNVSAFISGCHDLFDIIYYDPPYDDKRLEECLPSLFELLASNGVLVYERRSGAAASEKPPVNNEVTEIRSYGETEICIFRKQ